MREVLEVAGYLLAAAAWARSGSWHEIADDLIEQAAAILHLTEEQACVESSLRGDSSS